MGPGPVGVTLLEVLPQLADVNAATAARAMAPRRARLNLWTMWLG
jgi:hypothetical protein